MDCDEENEEILCKSSAHLNLTDPPPEANKVFDLEHLLQCLGEPHIESFNFMIDQGIDLIIKDIDPVVFKLPSGQILTLSVGGASFINPRPPVDSVGIKSDKTYPSECRQRIYTYKGKFTIRFDWKVDGVSMSSIEKDMGEIPIMLRSKLCNLYGLSPAELIAVKEHGDEWGGYFIVKGNERLIRMLIMTRSNYPMALKRSTWKNRGAMFSDMGILIRCVKTDRTSVNNNLHFVNDGTVRFMLQIGKALFYAPLMLILKSLGDYSDEYIYKQLTRGMQDDMYYCSCIQKMMRELHEEKLHSQKQCIQYLGIMFKNRFYELPDWYDHDTVGNHVLKKSILIHLETNDEKFFAITFMVQKLFALVQGKIKVEGSDAVMMQETLLGGHLYMLVLKERLQMFLTSVKFNLLKMAHMTSTYLLKESDIFTALKRTGTLENGLASFISTGNLRSRSGLGLMQDKGLSIVPENINRMRYMSHFKSIHRGSFFLEMRTTEARQLLPDAWGFICPVHTPDGSPCGLLNHLTMQCQITPTPDSKKVKNIAPILTTLGMIPISSIDIMDVDNSYKYPVLLEGSLLGYLPLELGQKAVAKLRHYKIKGEDIPNTTEIVLVQKKQVYAQFPGLFLFVGAARMMRPVINIHEDKVELIGTFEQVYMDVAITAQESYKGLTTHMELSKMSFLSNLAQLIPMPDCNQSPRNMYQCQMGKQTMGTPIHNWPTQTETKLYRLQTPASPLFKTDHYDKINMDHYPMGTNAIVAVISYTGYDMEDAMIINKSAFERGFAHGMVYKTYVIELKNSGSYFCRDPTKEALAQNLGTDGLPYIGVKLLPDDILYCYYDITSGIYKTVKYHSKEECYVDRVNVFGDYSLTAKVNRKACVIVRIPRNPSIGDKFASRAGQKGICSQKWPAEDLPFTESGLIPDIVFNPHGFPSRMTIAMMIETMAGKSSALHGIVSDATPFKFNEDDTAIDYFGRLLEAGGYNYYGTERMYSGVDGREMKADIFFGVVHYQRLRHMVADKWQVRSTGPIDALTRQPLKGRRRGGGVRFGEMERDSLISHGASFVLQDRLFHCSDKTRCLVCTGCGTLFGPMTVMYKQGKMSEMRDECRLCETGSQIAEMEIPYIFKYFATQLAAVNINVRINFAKS